SRNHLKIKRPLIPSVQQGSGYSIPVVCHLDSPFQSGYRSGVPGDPQGVGSGSLLVIKIGKVKRVKQVIGIPESADPPVDPLSAQSDFPGIVGPPGIGPVEVRVEQEMLPVHYIQGQWQVIVIFIVNFLPPFVVLFKKISIKKARSESCMNRPGCFLTR